MFWSRGLQKYYYKYYYKCDIPLVYYSFRVVPQGSILYFFCCIFFSTGRVESSQCVKCGRVGMGAITYDYEFKYGKNGARTVNG